MTTARIGATKGQTWDTFVNEMWAKYRTGPGMPPTDGWKKQHDDSYLKNAIAKELKGPTGAAGRGLPRAGQFMSLNPAQRYPDSTRGNRMSRSKG